MIWKAIGQNSVGTSHILANKPCEDSIHYTTVNLPTKEEVLICAISDGAGSAKYAKEASQFVTSEAVIKLSTLISLKLEITSADVFSVIEELYTQLKEKGKERNENLNEFSCTLLGSILFSGKAFFFQIGDGAIIRNDGADFYTPIWWPDNGEYQNTTFFLVDDESLSQLKILEIAEQIDEIAIFSDGLQLLTLNIENKTVHQPFFKSIFLSLCMANDESRLESLNKKLKEYLSSDLINSRTDDDKTLFLATRLKNDRAII